MRRRFDPGRYPHSKLTEQTIGAAIEVHRALGPGYLESIYEAALFHELTLRGLKVERQRKLEVVYKGVLVGSHRADLIVNELVLVELKAVEKLMPVHSAQVISTLKTGGLDVGLLINFNEAVLTGGGEKRIAASDLRS